MDQHKTFFLAVAFLVTLSQGTGLSVDINVGEVAEHGSYDFQYREEVSAVQRINSTIENLGSIGCTYRLKAEFNGENLSQTEYSRGYDLWPGDSEKLTVRHLPLNFTGEIDSKIYVNYCDQEERIQNFSYQWTERVLVNDSVDAETLDSNEEGAEVRFESVEAGELIPESAPGGWKVSSAKVRDGRAELEYSAPIFDDRKNITYKVVDGGEVLGITKVRLKEQKGVLDIVTNNVWKLLLLLVLSINAYLVFTGKLKL